MTPPPRLDLRCIALACALLLGCEGSLPLPSAPSPVLPPEVASFAPDAAYGGMTVVLEGRHLGAKGETVRVAFGGVESRATQAGDGTRLEVPVPRGAVTGPLRVETAAGSTVSATTFTFLGADKPVRGVIAARADLRTSVARARALPGARLLVDVRAGSFRRSWERARDGGLTARTEFEALTPDGATGLRLTRSYDDCAPSQMAFELQPLDGGASRFECLEPAGAPRPPLGEQPFRAAIDPGGRWAVVTAEGVRAWVLDLDAADPVVARLSLADTNMSLGVVALGRGRFAVGGGLGVRLLDAPARRFEDGAWNPGGVTLRSLGGGDDRLVTGTAEGTVTYANAATWPPTELRVLDTLHDGDVGSVALSKDWIAGAMRAENRLVLWRTDAVSTAPSASLEAEEVQAVSMREGLFAAGIRGAVLLVSAETGALVSRVRIGAGLSGLAVRQGANGPAIEVASRLMGRTLRLNATTLEREDGIASRDALANTAAGGGAVVAANADTPALYLMTEKGLEGTTEAAGSAERLVAFPDGFVPEYLALDPAGRAVFVLGTVDDRAHALVLDPVARRITLDLLPEGPWTWALVAGHGVFGLSTADPVDDKQSFQLFDTAAALEGQARAVGATHRPSFASSPVLFGGAAWLVDVGETPLRVDLATGAGRAAPLFPNTGGVNTATSPSDRRIYMLDYDAFGTQRLLGFTLAPADGAVLERDDPLPMPDGAGDLVVLPGGASLAITDTDEDALLLVQ